MAEIKQYTRQENYDNFLNIYKGNHYAVFESELLDKVKQRTGHEKARMIYIALNFAKLIVNKFADLMFLNPLKLNQNLDNLGLFEEFIQNSKLNALNWRLAVYTGIRGDGIYRLSVRNNRVFADYVNPSIWFPDYEGGEITRHIFEWIVEKNGKNYIRREVYEKGRVLNEIYKPKFKDVDLISDENKYDILGTQLDIKEFYPGLEPEISTGVDSFLVYHFKNDNVEDNFGTSEFADLMPLFDELNNRITQISNILDVHAEPEKFYPESYFEVDNVFYELYKKIRYIFKKRESNVYAIPQEEKIQPFALTWDAKLEACFSEIEFIMDSILSMAEMAPHLVYMKKVAETENAIRMQLTNTIAKVIRRRMIYEPLFVQMFTDFQDLVYNNELIRGEYGDLVVANDPESISIDWGEPIPISERERLEILEKKVKMDAISERRKVREANPELTDDEVETELQEIAKGYNTIS
ncbi:MAG: Phage portal protein, SPP1 Gp6-like [Candidatus Methanofastidiosum methylothiophilum]|uniref:Phage portal protein, SPP1 Gp6-like n=1 Tax=Candidatus Methanofastidiosum methylothiophilum TaxID=1705564 RepID=A0A150J8J6_9EURY|nr:MAG: Phage portal protein, SPP1 Gp6-like [Candidatus Methanofastidiosum methylthiophilus]KYC53530.1 MAG: Phage portal protein, SPP1 Gp6-like [Candidatus Methanofastidiosum methylthiophilus]